ncbi:hypothetical protein BV22DRAFT_502680 [Leucogyrophana mollusca]|uniref:Uncharacterized protein n=1 Tax=Leucogyrophana mollusca TaxID=85980 RepID=A0ACB8BGM8_9AGAM|nr:hypothetical protein BV22DRAFT_502680 [Leucogyrophana mollusca]
MNTGIVMQDFLCKAEQRERVGFPNAAPSLSDGPRVLLQVLLTGTIVSWWRRPMLRAPSLRAPLILSDVLALGQTSHRSVPLRVRFFTSRVPSEVPPFIYQVTSLSEEMPCFSFQGHPEPMVGDFLYLLFLLTSRVITPQHTGAALHRTLFNLFVCGCGALRTNQPVEMR